MQNNLPYATTYPAGEFVCEECGRNTFFSLVAIDTMLSDEELADFYRKATGRTPPRGTQGHWLVHPRIVKCMHCSVEYSTYRNEMEQGVDELEEP